MQETDIDKETSGALRKKECRGEWREDDSRWEGELFPSLTPKLNTFVDFISGKKKHVKLCNLSASPDEEEPLLLGRVSSL